jgi:hypothetical protein
LKFNHRSAYIRIKEGNEELLNNCFPDEPVDPSDVTESVEPLVLPPPATVAVTSTPPTVPPQAPTFTATGRSKKLKLVLLKHFAAKFFSN